MKLKMKLKVKMKMKMTMKMEMQVRHSLFDSSEFVFMILGRNAINGFDRIFG